MLQLKNKDSLISLLLSKSFTPNHELSKLAGKVVVFNTESVYHYFKNKQYKEYVNSCEHVFIDGAGIVFGAKLFGVKLSRFHGPDAFELITKQVRPQNTLVLGGAPENSELVKKGICGSWVPLPFESNPKNLVKPAVEGVSKAGDDVKYIFISLGLPKQELLARFLSNSFNSQDGADYVYLPLGAALDFSNGTKVRSSGFWQRRGLEWLPRLMREPRMLKRNIMSLVGLILLIKNGLVGNE